ncbi:winged helix-turn-helix transcriptional regulator [Streptomyces sp. 130]|uniref:MarR family winged helix-turn-helix transcriptional regulator n=1 Tax=Streptomyces sp. 130 TaxID=2591006 RepID=UPI0011809BF2|nr:MarR family winged helix-turn-helix transcriptional regulator [Streptomyces sp. 130]TRV81027.1 winged helix-turn-helix transcriptional regulator [Streptomyces sp. 130]
MSQNSASAQSINQVASGLVACLPALSRALERRVGQEFAAPKPPEAQLALLRHVEAHEGVTVRKAAESLLMKPNNVSALVTQLTEQGLLERRQDPADKRVAHLHLTAKARRELAEVHRLMGAHIAGALRTMTDGDLKALGAALGTLNSLAERLHSDQ